MQRQKPLYLLESSPPATTVPAFDQKCRSILTALSALPISNVTGVENRNLTPDGSEAPAAIHSGDIHPDQRLNNDDILLHRSIFVPSFHNLSDRHSLCLNGNDLYESLNPVGDIRHSFQPDASFSSKSEKNCFDPSTNLKTVINLTRTPLSNPNIRSLTTSFNAKPIIMNSVAGIPGSPPELSESRSSKSSSYGSQPSSPDEIYSGIMNFEDIGLDDDAANHSEQNQINVKESDNKENKILSKQGLKRPALSSIQTESKSYFRSVENGVRSAGVVSVKRGFTTPVITPSEHVTADCLPRTRSSSPPKRDAQRSASTHIRPGLSPSLTVPLRRGSWQPTRKTARQIEAEYHDSDDELPDDASLFNVPISPFPSQPRSARSSAHGSPERELIAQSPRPIPLDHAKTNPEVPLRKLGTSQILPRQRLMLRSSSTSLSKSNPSSPQANFMRNGRAKSWNIAMADLNHEARIIAEKLDFHLESGTTEDAIPTHRCSAPGAIPLPPIQTGTLDFMPMSKEKEAILSRTRPSWLPPKDPEEEKRHLKEYQRMMKASLEAEKRREEKLKQQRCVKQETIPSLNRIWTYYVDPTTDIATIDNRVHDLCWRGIPPKVRGKVWQRRIGNSLGLTHTSYQKATQRAQEIKSKSPNERNDQEKTMIAWFIDIERDAETAFPDLKVFQRQGPLWQDLINICEAYTAYRSDMGYMYGLQLVTALLLLQLPEPADVFILLANCLNKPMPSAFQNGEIEAVHRSYSKAISTLEIKFPRLHNYLFASQENGGLGFGGEELFGPMFRTLFANGLDADRLCRVWDIWVFDGDRCLIKSAVALLGSLQPQIFNVEGDFHLKRRNVQEMLGWGPFNRSQYGYWNLQDLGDDEAFVAEISNASRLEPLQ